MAGTGLRIRDTSLTGSDVDDQLALGGVIPDQSVGIANTLQREAPCIEQRRELAGFNEARRLRHDLTVMRAAFA